MIRTSTPLASILALLLFAGCYSRPTTHFTVGETEWFSISQTQFGYIVGPCATGFYKDEGRKSCRIQLRGKKEKYRDGEYVMNFARDDFSVSGTICVDWTKHKLSIDLTELPANTTNRVPCRINGTYNFHDE